MNAKVILYPIFGLNLGLYTQTSKDLGDNRSREHALLSIIIIIKIKLSSSSSIQLSSTSLSTLFPTIIIIDEDLRKKSFSHWKKFCKIRGGVNRKGSVTSTCCHGQLGRMEKVFSPKKSFPVFLKYGQLYFPKATESISHHLITIFL